MPYRSIVGKRVGVSGDQLLVNGRAVGGSMPTGHGKGKTWYVSSVINAGNGETVDGAAGTLQEVIDFLDLSSANDNRGDTIVILPNHAETITGIGGLTFDVPGLRVIGLGVGGQRPRFLMDGGTTVTAAVTGADTYIENCVFAAGHAAVATCFDVDAAGVTFVNCEFTDNTTHECFLIGILAGSTTDYVCDGLTVYGCNFFTATDRVFTGIKCVGGVKDMRIEGNHLSQGAWGGSAGSASISGLLDGTAGDGWTRILVKDNAVSSSCTATDAYPLLGLENDQTTNTGLVVNNRVATRAAYTNTVANANCLSKGTGFTFIGNMMHNRAVGGWGKLVPLSTDFAKAD